MPDTFISEPIEPEPGSFAAPTAAGEPMLPTRFTWRGERYEIADVLAKWKESGKERGGSEIYLRKHWYHIRTTDGQSMKIYFERQARSKGAARKRWWLYTVDG